VSNYLTVTEVAKLLRQKPRTIYAWVADRRIPHYKPGRALLFDPDEIDRWVKKHSREQERPLTPEGISALSSAPCQ
jgi:excisionase family DNA binding protein